MEKVELFFIPPSFYSQKARLALEEKGIKYKETYVFIHKNEQNQAWYRNINPEGEVPVLKIGDQCYNESDKIINLVDTLPSDIRSKLVPDPSTQEGKNVSEWRKWFDEIRVEIITFGMSVFPEFALDEKVDQGILPNAQGVRDRFERNIRDSEKMKLKNPHFTEQYDKKIALTKQRLADYFDKEKVSNVLDDTDSRIAKVEQQLLKMSAASGDEYFLCGQTFTAADINLCVLLGRLRLVGLLPRFADPQKYPTLDKYWQRMQKRPSVHKVVINNVSEIKQVMIKQKIRHYAGVAVALGVVGVAVWLARSHLKK